MINVNTAAVKSDITLFAQFSDQHVQQAIDQARAKAKTDGISPDDDEAYNLAVLNYARHVLNIDAFQNYGVVSANDLGQSETLANPNTYKDAYLNAYQEIADNYGGTGGSMDVYNGEHDNYFL